MGRLTESKKQTFNRGNGGCKANLYTYTNLIKDRWSSTVRPCTNPKLTGAPSRGWASPDLVYHKNLHQNLPQIQEGSRTSGLLNLLLCIRGVLDLAMEDV